MFVPWLRIQLYFCCFLLVVSLFGLYQWWTSQRISCTPDARPSSNNNNTQTGKRFGEIAQSRRDRYRLFQLWLDGCLSVWELHLALGFHTSFVPALFAPDPRARSARAWVQVIPHGVRPIPLLGMQFLGSTRGVSTFLSTLTAPVSSVLLVNNAWNNASGGASREEFDLRDAMGPHFSDFFTVVENGCNGGVAFGWNEFAQRASETGAEWWLVVSDDVTVKHGAFNTLSTLVDRAPGVGIFTACGNAFRLFAIRARVFDTVGPFDENFWPAYSEDCDYYTRMRRAGSVIFECDGNRFPGLHNPLVDHGHGKGSLSTFTRTHGASVLMQRSYYKSKWGSIRCGKPSAFEHVFNGSRASSLGVASRPASGNETSGPYAHRFWIQPEIRKARLALWKSQFSQPIRDCTSRLFLSVKSGAADF